MGLLTPLAVRIGALSWMPRCLPWIVKADDGIQAVSGGRVDLLTIAGLPSVTMVIPGRKTGIERTVTVLAAPVGPDRLVAGSYFGGPRSPAWVFNLRAAETVDVVVRGRRVPMVRRELFDDERARAWQELRRVWPNFDLYEQRTDRRIPVFRLSPR
ncbi:MAG: nitroreductase family deazaflavin-dependent oxidoreductase [Gordonia sp. (in: high G+C Gram-positive bacteria)]|uniref:nitroreductase family deazaflavin-dependent oxidoreductase n=1 Tax=Gordonia sp. (in: high G+C Gram-positive bacteria) TaxID=84139 RepID=UPI0039E7253C